MKVSMALTKHYRTLEGDVGLIEQLSPAGQQSISCNGETRGDRASGEPESAQMATEATGEGTGTSAAFPAGLCCHRRTCLSDFLGP